MNVFFSLNRSKLSFLLIHMPRSSDELKPIILSSVKIAEKPPFGKDLLMRLTVCSLCIESICTFSHGSHFGFEDRNFVLIVPFPNHCLLFYFYYI